jgi:hypothetical protein
MSGCAGTAVTACGLLNPVANPSSSLGPVTVGVAAVGTYGVGCELPKPGANPLSPFVAGRAGAMGKAGTEDGGGPPANSTVKVEPAYIPAGTTMAFKRPSGACT